MSTNTDEIMTDQKIKQFVQDIPKPKYVTSWKRILTFNQYVRGYSIGEQSFPGWLVTHPEETRLQIAINRVLGHVEAIQEVIRRKIDDIELDHCTTMHARAGDKESPLIIARDEKGNLCFTVEGAKAKRDATNKLINAEDIEIEPYYATELPVLSAEEREVFAGFVIKPELAAVDSEAA